jgi:hypothetical protein
MKTSISRIIVKRTDGDYGLRCDRFAESKRRFTREFFQGKVPATPYRVTYTVSPRGKYDVAMDSLGPELRNRRTRRDGMIICFLPNSWAGLRVSRKVVSLVKEVGP